ncbi:hypothetical protein XNC3_920037 [Xenorhabdus nematophila F1]|nr:hypothetical protein XNC3_920037 [Xenorhabdus nematophila F1]
MQKFPHCQFGLGIPVSDSFHIPGAGFFIMNVQLLLRYSNGHTKSRH